MIIKSNKSIQQAQCFLVPNVIVDNLIFESCPVYTAIYVYAQCQYQKGNLNLTNQQIANALKINVIDVVNAMLFYSSKGVLRVHNFKSVDDVEFDIEFLDGEDAETKAEIELKPNYKRLEINRALTDNPRISRMYKMVSQLLGKNLSTADTELLYSFYDFYAMPIEVIIVLVEYFVSKGKRSLKSMEKEVRKWSSAGVDSVNKAKSYIRKREEFLSFAYKVRSIVGISDRKLSTRELEYINKWQNEYKANEDSIKKAFNITVDKTGKLAFAYMDSILESWAKGDSNEKKKIKQQEKPRYNFEKFEKLAFENITKKSRGGTG